MSFRIENQTKAKQNRARTIYALQDAVNRVQNPNVSWLQGAIGGGGGGGGGVGGTPTDYKDLGTLDGTSSLAIALDGKSYYLRKVTLANSTALQFNITSENLPENELVELCIYFIQDATGGREIATPSAVHFPGGDLLNGALGMDPNEVSKFRFTTYDQGTTWFIEKLSLEGFAPTGAPSMADLSDTKIAALANEHILVYNTTNSMWENKLATSVGSQYGNTDVLTYLGTLGKSIWDGIVNLVSSVVGQITTWLENDNGILGWLYDFFTKPTSLGGLGTTITNALKSTMTWLTHAWNDTVGAIMKWFYKLNDSNEILFFPRAYGAGTEPSEDDIDNAATVPSNNKHTPFFSWTNFFSNFWARVTGFAEEVYADIIEWLQDDHGVLGWLYGQWVNISDNFEDAFENLTNLFALTDSSRRPLYVDHDDYPRLSFFGTSDLPITGSTTKADDDSTDLAYNIFYLPQNLWKWFTQSLDAGGTILTNMWNGFTGFLGKWWDRIGTSGFNISGAFGTIWSAIKTLGTGAWGVIKDIGSGIWSFIEHGVNFIGGLFYDKNSSDQILYYTQTEIDRPENIGGTRTTQGVHPPAGTKTIPKFRWTNFFGTSSAIVDGFQAAADAVIGGALTLGGAIYNSIESGFDGLLTALGGTIEDTWETLTDHLAGLANWLTGGGGGASILNQLTDVSISSPRDRQILTFIPSTDTTDDEDVGTWFNRDLPLDHLSNVNISGVTGGQVLAYLAGNPSADPPTVGEWRNLNLAAGAGANTDLTNLGDNVAINRALVFSNSAHTVSGMMEHGIGVDQAIGMFFKTRLDTQRFVMEFGTIGHSIEFHNADIRLHPNNATTGDPTVDGQIKAVKLGTNRATIKARVDGEVKDLLDIGTGDGGGGGGGSFTPLTGSQSGSTWIPVTEKGDDETTEEALDRAFGTAEGSVGLLSRGTSNPWLCFKTPTYWERLELDVVSYILPATGRTGKAWTDLPYQKKRVHTVTRNHSPVDYRDGFLVDSPSQGTWGISYDEDNNGNAEYSDVDVWVYGRSSVANSLSYVNMRDQYQGDASGTQNAILLDEIDASPSLNSTSAVWETFHAIDDGYIVAVVGNNINPGSVPRRLVAKVNGIWYSASLSSDNFD